MGSWSSYILDNYCPDAHAEVLAIGMDGAPMSECLDQFDGTRVLRAQGARNIWGIESDSFDCILYMSSLQQVRDREQQVAELGRMLKCGGVMICVQQDLPGIALAGIDVRLAQKAVRGCEAGNDWNGRDIWGLFNRAGLFQGTCSCHSLVETAFSEGLVGYQYVRNLKNQVLARGFMSTIEYCRLVDEAKTAAREGRYLFSMPIYIYRGVKKGK